MRKKLLILLLALSTFSLCACGKTPDTDVDKEPAAVTEAPEEKEEQNNDKEEDNTPDEETEQPTEAPVVEEKKYGEDEAFELMNKARLKPENQMFIYEGKSVRTSTDANGALEREVVEIFSGENAYTAAYSKYDVIITSYQPGATEPADVVKERYESYVYDYDITHEDILADHAVVGRIRYDKLFESGYTIQGDNQEDYPWYFSNTFYGEYAPYWILDSKSWWSLEGLKVSYADDEILLIMDAERDTLKYLYDVYPFATAYFLSGFSIGKDTKLVIAYTKDLVLKRFELTPGTIYAQNGSSTTYEFNMTFTPITEPQFTPPAELLAIMGE